MRADRHWHHRPTGATWWSVRALLFTNEPSKLLIISLKVRICLRGNACFKGQARSRTFLVWWVIKCCGTREISAGFKGGEVVGAAAPPIGSDFFSKIFPFSFINGI